MLNRLFLTALLALSSLVLTSPAKASEVCNETSYVIEAAMAWRTPAGLAVEGWSDILPGTCSQMGPEADTEQYLYARSTKAYLGGIREWRGGQQICVDEEDFAFEGVADCEALGLESRAFRALNDAERSRTVLVELADFKDRAEEAGLQRLLQAAGYDINVIDGYAGRRTRRQVAAFERDIERQFGADRTGLLQALHAHALERNAEAGLRVCNDTQLPMGVTVSRATGDGWETRGWWRVAAGACAHAISAHITANETYVYAQLIDGDQLRPLAAGTERFCIAPARFTSEQRDNCENTGFEGALFRAAPEPDAGGATLHLSVEDFEEPLP